MAEFRLFGQKLYLSPILGFCSRDSVSYAISERSVFSMVTQMLEKKGVRQSMSRKGDCLDIAVIENFFSLLKTELFNLQKFEFMKQFKAELIDYLDYYNNLR